FLPNIRPRMLRKLCALFGGHLSNRSRQTLHNHTERLTRIPGRIPTVSYGSGADILRPGVGGVLSVVLRLVKEGRFAALRSGYPPSVICRMRLVKPFSYHPSSARSSAFV